MNPKNMNLTPQELEAMKRVVEKMEKLETMKEESPKVDFRLLWELHQEFPSYTVGELIGYLEMNDVPMTEAVRKLGICAGILYG